MKEGAGGLEEAVGWILLGGVLLSCALLAAGLVWQHMVVPGTPLADPLAGTTAFRLAVADLRQLATGTLGPRLLVNLGLAVLLATPYLRVVASMLYFAFAAHDTKYALFTAFVLVTLTYSLFLR
ncbi:MAG TPA: DUF1634 domain-containing protein [Candidatus Binatia bacterium]|nr:DUF1634 domain-containing protein [Candidatus Binatia bacterium]